MFLQYKTSSILSFSISLSMTSSTQSHPDDVQFWQQVAVG